MHVRIASITGLSLVLLGVSLGVDIGAQSWGVDHDAPGMVNAHRSLRMASTFPLSAVAERMRTWVVVPSMTDTVNDASTPQSKDSSLYFRPVSTTLYCVMILTVESLLVYTVLAFARNSDELAGKTRPSLFTQTFSAVSRSAVYPSMLSMLFVGCRMYVLATTKGLGEPPLWVKCCMIAATVGMSLQFLATLILPLVTEQGAEDDISFEVRVGGPYDVHPMMGGHPFKNTACKIFFWGMQILTMLLIYVGVFGVIAGIFTFPSKSTQISPAVICTCVLSALYFAVFAALWLGRNCTDLFGVQAVRLTRAALCMSYSVRSAPMLAVIFLAARMRALQLDPPLGMPPRWAQACFFAMTAAVYLETIMAGYIGATGAEIDDSSDKHAAQVLKGIYGLQQYIASRGAHIFKHVFSSVIYLGLGPVVTAIFLMEAKDGNPAPLSPTLQAVLWYTMLFFGIFVVQWITFLLRDVFKFTCELLQSTVLASGVSITFVPNLCILFVACRMRALQITQQKGSPPGWAQDCMFLSIFATYTQVLCCLLMPIFTNNVPDVDGDGNVEYDLRPMIGAYAVAIVKYVSLLCLHGGVIVVCMAVFVMTPETAKRVEGPFDLKKIFEMVGVGMLVLCIAMLLSSAKVVGLAIKMGIESVPDTVIGARIKVAKAALSICEGYVNVSGFRIENPTRRLGHDTYEPHWAEENKYLFRIDKLIVKINMWRLAKSFGKEFELTAIVLKGVHVTVEKPSMKEVSNVNIVKEFLDQYEPVELQQADMVFVEHVNVESIGGRIISPMFDRELPSVPKVNVTFTAKKGGGMQPMEVVAEILKSIVNSVAASTASLFTPSLAGAINMGKSLAHMVSAVCKPCAGGVPTAPPKKQAQAPIQDKVEAPGADSQQG